MFNKIMKLIITVTNKKNLMLKPDFLCIIVTFFSFLITGHVYAEENSLYFIHTGLSDKCSIVPEEDTCKANFHTIYFDAASGKCKEVWGCYGSVFKNMNECRILCEKNTSSDISPSESLFLYLKQDKVDPKIVRYLIEYGADVNYRDKRHHTTPLHNVARYRHTDIVRLLVDSGADINSEDEDKRTPLHDAMTYKSFEIVKLLIEKGADVNLRNKDGETPLFSIVFWDDIKKAIEVVKLFFENGFDINRSTDANFLNETIKRGHRDIAMFFLKKGIKFNDISLLDAARNGYDDIFNFLLEKGANPEQKDILHNACESGNINIIKTITTKGVETSIEDIDFCLYNGHKEAAIHLNMILKSKKNQQVDIKKRCQLKPDSGTCKALFWRAYFDPVSNKCREFAYGGCEGVDPFENLEACKRVCEE